MKAATGELNLTVITLIAIAAVIGFFWVMWPRIQIAINSQWENISSGGPSATTTTPTPTPGVVILER